jgi:hypothetical protein
MSFIKLQSAHDASPVISNDSMISSDDGDDTRESGYGLIKHLFVTDEVLTQMVVETPLLLLIGLLAWPALRDSRSQD